MCVHIIHTYTFNKLSRKTGDLSKYKDVPMNETEIDVHNKTKNDSLKETKNSPKHISR